MIYYCIIQTWKYCYNTREKNFCNDEKKNNWILLISPGMAATK